MHTKFNVNQILFIIQFIKSYFIHNFNIQKLEV